MTGPAHVLRTRVLLLAGGVLACGFLLCQLLAPEPSDPVERRPAFPEATPAEVPSLAAAPAASITPAADRVQPALAEFRLRILVEDRPAAGAELLVLPWTDEIERAATGVNGIPARVVEAVEHHSPDATGTILLSTSWNRAFAVAQAPHLAPRGFFLDRTVATELNVSLDAGHSMSGKVVDADGEPIVDAEVSTRIDAYRLAAQLGEGISERRLLGMLWSRAVRTDQEGRFRLDALPPGPHCVLAEHPLFATDDRIVYLPEDAGLELVLTLAAGASLQGVVVDSASGAPVPDAVIQSSIRKGSGFSSQGGTESGARGEFHLAVRAGTSMPVRLEVEHADYAVHCETLGPFAPGQVVHHEVRLEAARSLTGTVLDPDGAPVARAKVMASDAATGDVLQAVFTGEDGAYDLDRSAAGRLYRIDAEAAGFIPQAAETRVGDPPLALVLERTARIAGRLVPPPGATLEGGFVRLAGERDGADRMGTLYVDVEPDGTFDIVGLWPLRYQIDASAKGFGITRVSPVDLTSGEEVTDLEIALEPAVALRGRVTAAATGEPVVGAAVALADADTMGRILDDLTEPVTTDAQGLFVLPEEVAPGTPAKVLVRHADYAPALARVEVQPGAPEAWVDVELDAPAGLRLIRLDRAGKPKPGLLVVLDVANDMRHQSTTTENVLEWTNLPPGPARVIVNDLRQAEWLRTESAFREFELEPGRTSELVIHDGPSGRIAGRISGAGIAGLVPAVVQVSTTGVGETQYRNAVAANEDWTFALEEVAPGEQLLWVACWQPDAIFAWNQPVTVTEGATTEVAIEIPGGGIRGRVLDTRSRPIPEARISLRERAADGQVRPWHSMPCAEDGSFRIRGCRAGTYELVGRADGYGRRLVRVRVPDAAADLEQTFRLEKEGFLRVRGVVAGQPLADAAFSFALGDLVDPPVAKRGRDDDGYARYAGLDVGTYRVRATHPDHFPGEAIVRIVAGETATLDVALRRRCELEVRVVDATGQELVGAPVLVADAVSGSDSRAWLAAGVVATTPPNARTDEEGRVRFRGVPEGELTVSTPGGVRAVVAEPGALVELKLQVMP